MDATHLKHSKNGSTFLLLAQKMAVLYLLLYNAVFVELRVELINVHSQSISIDNIVNPIIITEIHWFIGFILLRRH